MQTTYKSPKELVQPAVQANKEHQYALKVYSERLETELKHLDKLLASAEVSDNEEEDALTVNSGGSVSIPGAVRPRGVVSAHDLASETSPFYHDVMKRQRYEECTVAHPMKAQELEALSDAVRSENYRLYALEAQAQGLPAFTANNEPPPDFNMNKHGIDWERVAQKVSSASTTVQRTAKECEIRWLGERHPQFSNAQWTQSEIARVKELVAGSREGEVDWVVIAEKLGTGRTPVDCMRHAVVRRTHTWTSDADKRLLEAVDIYGTDNWGIVARRVSEDATAAQCQNRYTRTLDPNLKRGPWTTDEDEQLRRAVAVFGQAWVEVAPYIEGRNNEQCRDRYQAYLNPSLTKGRWTDDQDAALIKTVEQVGEGRWKEVSRVLNLGRTDSMCRMRFTLLMKKKRQLVTMSPGPDSREASQGPSRASGSWRESSRLSTPMPTPMSGTPPILILHPESYSSRSSTGTPAPTPAPRPKPRPRPRGKKAAPAAVETVSAMNPPGEKAAGPSNTGPTSGGPEKTSGDEPAPTRTNRPSPDSELERTGRNKRRRTSSPPSSSTPQPGDAIIASRVGDNRGETTISPAHTSPHENYSTEIKGSIQSPTSRIGTADVTAEGAASPGGRGKGRARGRGRGTGRGRGRGGERGRGGGGASGQSSESRDLLEPGDDDGTGSVAQKEIHDTLASGQSAGPAICEAAVSAPTRRQPRRTTTK